MKPEDLKELFLEHRESGLYHRYITNKSIAPLLSGLNDFAEVEVLGHSVLGSPIHGIKVGHGGKKVLMWSQMHGNESTTTKALFDLLNTLKNAGSTFSHILNNLTLFIIPILNPDGAAAYTRVNANKVDLNRDAQNLTQPESKVLRKAFSDFKPHFCYNLHGQRTIFSAGKQNKSAIVSFLSPAQDLERSITDNRKRSMEIIAVMNRFLQGVVPNHIGVYDNAFNINCVGDTFQSENVPTMLFEAGHFPGDYARERTRELVFYSYMVSLDYISQNIIEGEGYKDYLNIPENEKCFFDVIIRNAQFKEGMLDVAIQFQEQLQGNRVEFVPKVVKIESLKGFFGHKEIDALGKKVFNEVGEPLKIDGENVFVMIDGKKIALLSK